MSYPDPIAYQSISRETVDDGHLRTLSIMHYVLGGLDLVFGFIPLFYVGMGIFMMSGGFNKMMNSVPPATQPGPPMPDFTGIGVMFVIFGSIACVLGWTLGILTIIVGRRIDARRSYVFCMVIAAIQCIFFPLGTALGVFTLIVLSRETVSASFKANRPAIQV